MLTLFTFSCQVLLFAPGQSNTLYEHKGRD